MQFYLLDSCYWGIYRFHLAADLEPRLCVIRFGFAEKKKFQQTKYRQFAHTGVQEKQWIK